MTMPWRRLILLTAGVGAIPLAPQAFLDTFARFSISSKALAQEEVLSAQWCQSPKTPQDSATEAPSDAKRTPYISRSLDAIICAPENRMKDQANELAFQYELQLRRKKVTTSLKKAHTKWVAKLEACKEELTCLRQQLVHRRIELNGVPPPGRIAHMHYRWERTSFGWIPSFFKGASPKALKKINQSIRESVYGPGEGTDPEYMEESFEFKLENGFLMVTNHNSYCPDEAEICVTQIIVLDIQTGETFDKVAGEATEVKAPTKPILKFIKSKKEYSFTSESSCSEKLIAMSSFDPGKLSLDGHHFTFSFGYPGANCHLETQIPTKSLKRHLSPQVWKKVEQMQSHCKEKGTCAPEESLGALHLRWESRPSEEKEALLLWYPQVISGLDSPVKEKVNAQLKEATLGYPTETAYLSLDNGYLSLAEEAREAAFAPNLALDLKTGEKRSPVILETSTSWSLPTLQALTSSPEAGRLDRVYKNATPSEHDYGRCGESLFKVFDSEPLKSQKMSALELSLDGKWARVFYLTEQDKKDRVCFVEGSLPLTSLDPYLTPAAKKKVAEVTERCAKEPTCASPVTLP
jgi:hypothetical protein